MSRIIKKPLMTEKNNKLSGVYVFEVARPASKPVIREHIEKYFGVKVESIRTAIGRGRAKRTQKGLGAVPYFKKAFVRLKKGQKIALFEGG